MCPAPLPRFLQRSTLHVVGDAHDPVWGEVGLVSLGLVGFMQELGFWKGWTAVVWVLSLVLGVRNCMSCKPVGRECVIPFLLHVVNFALVC